MRAWAHNEDETPPELRLSYLVRANVTNATESSVWVGFACAQPSPPSVAPPQDPPLKCVSRRGLAAAPFVASARSGSVEGHVYTCSRLRAAATRRTWWAGRGA